jgi:hypothetical protein
VPPPPTVRAFMTVLSPTIRIATLHIPQYRDPRVDHQHGNGGVHHVGAGQTSTTHQLNGPKQS